MKLRPLFSLTLLAAMTAACGSAFAALSAQEVERLGKDLTPMGAEKAANKDSSIPAWTGGLAARPAGIDAQAVYADPFASEKPLYTITAANVQQYQDKLAPGQIELLKRMPTYKIVVYPSHRTAALPQREYESIKAEAGKSAVSDGGNGLLNVKSSAVPFPIPKTGVEAIWNHLTRYRGESFTRYTSILPVQTNGEFTPVTSVENFAMAAFMKTPEPNRLFYYLRGDLSPSSQAGNALMVHQTVDQIKESRLAWLYNPGSRRVLRAPEVSYDSPSPGADGLMTSDDYDGFNGAPDRYDWKLVGKKEMVISYNNYRMVAKDVKPSDLAKAGHINQDLARYELHRVWVVEATLKAGKRHVYGKRTYYIDEDSWQIAHADISDGRGELWRVREVHAMQMYDAPAPTPGLACDVQYDLQARRYLVSTLINAAKPTKYNLNFDANSFSTDAMRRFVN